MHEQKKSKYYLVPILIYLIMHMFLIILLSELTCMIHFQNKSKFSLQPQAKHRHREFHSHLYTDRELTQNKGYNANYLIRLSNVNNSASQVFRFEVWSEILKLQFIIPFTEQKHLGCNNKAQFCLYSSMRFSVLTLTQEHFSFYG